MCAFAIVSSLCIKHFRENVIPREYVVYRANRNDTLTIKADTFRVFPRENKAYFVKGEDTIAEVDSVNLIKRK